MKNSSLLPVQLVLLELLVIIGIGNKHYVLDWNKTFDHEYVIMDQTEFRLVHNQMEILSNDHNNIFQGFFKILKLFERRWSDPCMTANRNFVRFAHSL